MIGEMVCPDCGGVVGAAEQTEAGPPCRCFTDNPSSLSGSGMATGLSSGTLGGSSLLGRTGTGAAGDPSDAGDLTASDLPALGGGSSAAPVATAVAKICRICGKDVAGQRRVKDSQGYYCVPCAKEEEKRENGGRVRCRVCGRLVREERLVSYEGTRMCPNCHQQREDLRKQQIKRIGFKGAQVRDELRHVYTYLAIGGILLLVIVGSSLIAHFHH